MCAFSAYIFDAIIAYNNICYETNNLQPETFYSYVNECGPHRVAFKYYNARERVV